MKKMILVAIIMVVVSFLAGCATPRMTGSDAKKGWSRFTGKTVIDIREVYPDGDAPRNLIEIKDGGKRIY